MIFKAESEVWRLPKKKRKGFMNERIREVIKLEPDNGSLHLILAGLEERDGKQKEADEEYALFEKLCPGKGGVKSLRLYFSEPNSEAFRKQYELDDATWMNPMVQIFDEDDYAYEDPEDLFPSRKVKKEPKSRRARRGGPIEDSGVDQRAVDVLRARSKLFFDHKPAEALTSFEHLLPQTNAPNGTLFLKNFIGDCQVRLGRSKEGEATLLDVISKEKSVDNRLHSARAYNLLANLYYRQGRMSDCKNAIEKTLAIKEQPRYIRIKAFGERALGLIAAKEKQS